MNHSLELINFALTNSNFHPVDKMDQVTYLGEGAWHKAYLIAQKHDQKLVIRFPKEIAYEKKVEFDENAIHAEYGGTKRYYQMASEVSPGVCPDFFDYYVEQGKTYTIETYMGQQIVLENLQDEEAYNVGASLGEFFRNMNEADHSLKGFGYLSWNGEDVQGQFHSDVTEFMKEENEEYEQDYNEICEWNKDFAVNEIKSKLMESLASRTIDKNSISFTNQDTSPENILVSNNQVHLIDPVPILYYGHSFAGNLLNNYNVLFPTFYNAPRYEKHQFNRYEKELQSIGNGFLEGYVQGNPYIKQLILREQFIKLFGLAFNHYKLAINDLNVEQSIRYGTKEAITNRIPVFLKKLKDFKLD